jgi:hypothetical protein
MQLINHPFPLPTPHVQIPIFPFRSPYLIGIISHLVFNQPFSLSLPDRPLVSNVAVVVVVMGAYPLRLLHLYPVTEYPILANSHVKSPFLFPHCIFRTRVTEKTVVDIKGTVVGGLSFEGQTVVKTVIEEAMVVVTLTNIQKLRLL